MLLYMSCAYLCCWPITCYWANVFDLHKYPSRKAFNYYYSKPTGCGSNTVTGWDWGVDGFNKQNMEDILASSGFLADEQNRKLVPEMHSVRAHHVVRDIQLHEPTIKLKS